MTNDELRPLRDDLTARDASLAAEMLIADYTTWAYLDTQRTLIAKTRAILTEYDVAMDLSRSYALTKPTRSRDYAIRAAGILVALHHLTTREEALP